MKNTLTATFAVIALLALPGAARADTQFVIVQPGYPGSTSEAESFVNDLSRALEASGAPAGLSGEYHNDAAEALKAIGERHPQFGLVSLGFYLAHREDLRLTPLLESRPAERFYLAGKKGATVAPRELSGKPVAGTPFEEIDFVARILFGPGAGGGPAAPAAGEGNGGKQAAEGAGKPAASGGSQAAADVRAWKVQPTTGFTKAVRDVGSGKASAVLLTERECRALPDLEAGKKVEVYYRTEELPTSLMVAFGEAGPAAKKSAEALAALKDNAQAKDLLSLMGIEGFAKADRDRMQKLERRYGESPPPPGNGARAGGR